LIFFEFQSQFWLYLESLISNNLEGFFFADTSDCKNYLEFIKLD